MSNTFFNQAAPKKSANLSLNADLLQQAKQLNINLSQTLEQHLADIIRQAQRGQWLAENQDALEAYNRRMAPLMAGRREAAVEAARRLRAR